MAQEQALGRLKSHAMSSAHLNPFKVALAARDVQFGIWSTVCSNLLAEITGRAGFDWILLDTEHAPNDLQTLISQLQALQGSRICPVARPGANDKVMIKRLLDIGFRSLIIPYVESAEEAAEAVRATRYPPRGIRGVSASQRNNGYGTLSDYFSDIDDAIAVVAQIETVQAMSRLEEIAAVEGIDAIFVGPGDLAESLSHRGDTKHPDVQSAIKDIGARTRRIGVATGVVASNIADAARYQEWGFCLTTVCSDMGLFKDSVCAAAQAARQLHEKISA